MPTLSKRSQMERVLGTYKDAVVKQLNEEMLMAKYSQQAEVFDRPLIAKYAGRCTACGKGFQAGAQVRWVKNANDTKPRVYCADAATCAGSLVPAIMLPESDQAEIALLLQNGDTNTALKRKQELEEQAAKSAAQAEIDEIEALLKEMS